MSRAKNPLEFDKETITRIYRDAGLCYECGRRLEKCDHGNPEIRNEIISLFTTSDLVQSGIECGCFSCDGAVENVINAYDVAEIHKYSMINRVYFVDFLRTVLFSKSVDHSWKV